MAISLTTPNLSSSSSQPATQKQQQKLPTSLESQPLTPPPPHQNQINTCPSLPIFISGGDSNTTPNQDQDATTTSHERRIETFDLNDPPSDLDVANLDIIIPQRIRLTNLKPLARFQLENPVQKKKSKNEQEDTSAGANIDDPSQQQLDVACQSNSSSRVRRRRNRCPGKNGRTCHQCHQKTLDFVVCKSGSEEMPCTKAYCVKCILNRYGDEEIEVAHSSNDWRCPCCQLSCNCGRCMKEKGLQPVGIRGRAGKTARFRSIMERLAASSSKNINDRKETSATEESVSGSDGRKDAGSSNSMEVHLSSEFNPRVGVEDEKSKRAGGDVKNISDVIKTVSSRNDVLSVLLSPSRVDYESLLQQSNSV